MAETYVIFITERDVLKGGLPIYHIDRTIAEMQHSPFGDGNHIIYVNSQIKDETKLGRLMHDFSCTNADDMAYSILADRVRYFKEEQEGVATMCKVMEDMRKEERKNTLLENLRSIMKTLHLTIDQAMDALSVSPEERPMLREKLMQ